MHAGMEGSTLGAWVAHGEGRAEFKSEQVFDYIMVGRRQCALLLSLKQAPDFDLL